MSGLTGKAIKDTYKSLLKINDDGLITEVFKNVTDGENNSSGLYLKREGIYVSGSFESDNITGSLQGTSSYAVTASYALNNAGVAISALTPATATNTINNDNYQQNWNWNNLGSGIGLKLASSSTQLTGNTQVLLELRRTTLSSGTGNGSTVLNVINEDNNPSSVTKAAHFEARGFAATFGKTGINAGYGNVGILGNSKLSFFHNGVESAYIYRMFNTALLHIVAPSNGGITISTGSDRQVSFDRGALANDIYMAVGYTSTTKQTQVFGGDNFYGYRATSTHAGVIENESGVFKFSANSGLSGGYAPFTPTWQLVLHGANNNVGVGTLTPNASAKLDVSSTTQGFAPPEMTATQASAITTTTRKLIIYVTDTNGTFTSAGLWMWNGTTWKLILAE